MAVKTERKIVFSTEIHSDSEHQYLPMTKNFVICYRRRDGHKLYPIATNSGQ